MRITTKSCLAVCGAFLMSASAMAVPIVITYGDGVGEGFNDPALGAARRACIEAAASNWANRLAGTVPIQITAKMDPMGGTATSAILGGASARYTIRNFPGAPLQEIGYAAAQANQIAGSDLSTIYEDINITYNSDVDGPVVLSSASFYYGTDGRLAASGGEYYDIDFYNTCLHEIGHGLGFFSGVIQDGSFATVVPLIYDTFLATGSTAGATMFTTLTQAQRSAALTGDFLFFSGPNARASAGGTNPRIYAPTTYQPGSTRSHLREDSYSGTMPRANLNELMTPFLGPGVTHYPGPMVSGVFEDIGWSFIPYTTADAATALRIYSGLQKSNEANIVRLNRDVLTLYPGVIRFADVIRVIRAAAGADTNPYILGTP